MRLLLITSLLFIFHSSFAADKDFITGDWKFIYGDNASYSDIGIDASDWQSVELDKTLPANLDYAITGWYRVHFDAHVDISEQYSLIIESLRLADETWINGIKVGGLGQFNNSWRFEQNNPLGLIRKYDLPAGFLKYKNNLLAIKVVTGFGNAIGAVLPVGVGLSSADIFLSELEFANKYYNKQVITTSSIDAVFLTMGLIELFMLLFLIRNALANFSEFKWLFLTSLTLFIGGIGHDLFFIFDLSLSNHYLTNSLLFSFVLLIAPLTLMLYFWSQFKRMAIKYMLMLSLLFIVLCFGILLPVLNDSSKTIFWYLWLLMTLGFIIYSFYMAIHAIKLGKTGSVAQLIGFTVLIVSALLHNFGNGFFGHRNIQFGSLFYRYLILFAYFQKIKMIRLDFKKLSARMVSVVEEVNAKIARELHDGIGQNLASMKIHSQLLAKNLDDKHSKSIGIIKSELDNSTTNLREIINGLHPEVIDRYTIYESISKECVRLENIFSIKINLSNASENVGVNLSKNIKLNVFRIFQECVNNAIKHGKANKIDVFLSIDKFLILMNIQDDGSGYQLSSRNNLSDEGGLGFISLHERVALLNGQIDFESQTNRGSSVRVVLPLD